MYSENIITVCNAVYFRLCIDLMHILPPVTAEGFDGSHHPRFAEWFQNGSLLHMEEVRCRHGIGRVVTSAETTVDEFDICGLCVSQFSEGRPDAVNNAGLKMDYM